VETYLLCAAPQFVEEVQQEGQMGISFVFRRRSRRIIRHHDGFVQILKK
jgi:hypothetical protein